MTKIIVNGHEVDADPTQPLIHACHQSEVDVPMYCYHPGLSPVGSCRICQVQVQVGEMPPRVVVACKTPITEGMVVDTEAPKAHDARRECLEFLLKNHPLDCPICDKAGECDLQDFAFQEGQAESRSTEPRRKLEKRKSLGDVIVLDQERCVLCSRCVRFFEEVTEKPQLTVSGLGAKSVISTFADRPLEGNYQGNVADICPVGALTLDKFRFQARVWNLSRSSSSCGECSRGCSISVEVLRGGEVKRIRPRYDADVNDWWMCDFGRFAFDRYNDEGRLVEGAVRSDRGLVTAPLGDSLERAADVLRAHPGATLVASPFLTVEEGERLVAFAKAIDAPQPRFLSPAESELGDDLLHTGDPCPNRRGLEELGMQAVEAEALAEELAGAPCAVLVGERIGELLGAERAEALPASLRLVVLDTHPLFADATDVCLSVPYCVERTGTWLNVDGIERPISPARPRPSGVREIHDHLDALEERILAPVANNGRGRS